jgi:thioesterase domain-containing protein
MESEVRDQAQRTADYIAGTTAQLDRAVTGIAKIIELYGQLAATSTSPNAETVDEARAQLAELEQTARALQQPHDGLPMAYREYQQLIRQVGRDLEYLVDHLRARRMDRVTARLRMFRHRLGRVDGVSRVALSRYRRTL